MTNKLVSVLFLELLHNKTDAQHRLFAQRSSKSCQLEAIDEAASVRTLLGPNAADVALNSIQQDVGAASSRSEAPNSVDGVRRPASCRKGSPQRLFYLSGICFKLLAAIFQQNRYLRRQGYCQYFQMNLLVGS